MGAEIIKRRPCVVISPRLRGRDGLCTVVPLSTTEPRSVMPHQCKIILSKRMPAPFNAPEMWAKCDLLNTVAYERLDGIHLGKDQYGKRKYLSLHVSAEQLILIKNCVLHAIGMYSLTVKD